MKWIRYVDFLGIENLFFAVLLEEKKDIVEEFISNYDPYGEEAW